MFCSKTCVADHQRGFPRVAIALHTRFSFRKEKGKCERCGWDKAVEVLHVHHKDHNKLNDSRDNWEVLCPTCHRYHHWIDQKRHKYSLVS